MRLPDGAVAYGAVSKGDVGGVIEGVCKSAIQGADAEAATSYSFEFVVGKLDRFDTGVQVHRVSPVLRVKTPPSGGSDVHCGANMSPLTAHRKCK